MYDTVSSNEHNPFKEPDWRWNRITDLVSKGHYPSRSRDDRTVQQGYRFWKTMRGGDPLDHINLSQNMPGPYFAYLIRDNNNQHTKWAIEARLLAAESHDSIARKCRTTPLVIDWYEKLFFNVSDSLDCGDYIINTVMGSSVHSGLKERDYDLLWKLYGYLHGPIVLDLLIQHGQISRRPQHVDEAAGRLDAEVNLGMRLKASLATRMVPIYGDKIEVILNTYMRMVELERTADTPVHAQDQIMQNIQAMVEGLTWTTGHRAASKLSSTKIYTLDNQAAELRSNELVTITADRDIEDADDLETIRMPEPPARKESK